MWDKVWLPVVLAGGGLVTRWLSPLWVVLWRRCEFAADRWAFLVGQGPALAEYLEGLQVLDCAIPGVGRAHPYVEQRLARLEGLEGGGGVVE